VSLVVGPAGSGKTQLVASWVTSEWVNAPVAWVTVEDDDDRTGVFWAYVVEALRRAGVAATPPLTPLTSTATVDRSFLVRLTAALAQQQKPVVLVLDGVSNLTGEQWAADLAFVLRHTGSLLRLVLVGRWDPPLPLHRYRLAGRLNEIRSKDLAFTADEATDLLTQHGVELSPTGLASLLEHTEGWAAGLRLFAMALEDRHDADRLVDVITGNEATIAEYFVDEVLRLQPAHVRAFLLEASILETFTPELAEAVTGRSDSRRLLMELQRQNAFVQRAGEYSTAYRIHRLFAELLRAQLVCEAPELTAQLHRRAADWFAAQGQTVEAVSHAVKAGAWVAAATIIIEHYAIGRLVLDGGASRLGALVRHLPGDLDSPEVATVAAASALADRATDRCAQQVSRVHELMMRREYVCGDALALAEFLVEVLLADLCGDSSQVLHTTSLIDYFVTQVPPKQLTRHPERRALILAARGAAQSRVGAIDAATVTLTEAAAIAEPGCEYPRIDCLQHLALIEAYRGRLRRAEKLADEAWSRRAGRSVPNWPWRGWRWSGTTSTPPGVTCAPRTRGFTRTATAWPRPPSPWSRPGACRPAANCAAQ
jgi:LuxR family transcriptional regulator, maltose regulon positive regulatory protein